MAKSGSETALTLKMRKAGLAKYGDDLVVVKYVGCLGAEVGVSDLLCTLRGISVACEVKSPDSSTHKRKTVEASIEHALTVGPTVKQRDYVRRVLAAGGVAGFAATIEQFMVMLACADARSKNPAWTCAGHNLNGVDQ